MHNEELYTGIGEENRGKKCTIERGKTPPRRKYDFNEKKMEKIHIKYTNKQNTKKKTQNCNESRKKRKPKKEIVRLYPEKQRRGCGGAQRTSATTTTNIELNRQQH